jgi:hypothetical protein
MYPDISICLARFSLTDELLRVYRQMPDYVKVIVTKDLGELIHFPHNKVLRYASPSYRMRSPTETLDHNEKYVQSEAMPDGIPIWKSRSRRLRNRKVVADGIFLSFPFPDIALVFHMTFFPTPGSGLLGGNWAINAVPHPVRTDDFHYIG